MKGWRITWISLWLIVGWALRGFAGEMTAPPVQPVVFAPALTWSSIVTSVVYGLLGLIMLLIGYYLYEMVTPFSVKEELITHRNVAVGIVVAAFILGMSIVIAAAII